VALDHITDPHNLGAILRSVHWFGAPLVVIPERRSAAEGDVVSRSSAGAVAYTTITYVPNLRNALETLKRGGYWTYAADGGGIDVREAQINPPSVLVLGAEGRGISPGLEKVIDQTIAIPRDPGVERSSVDSLNVCVSAGVLLYELFRRKPG
jgi:23S rRNA (guanosine2251-2'-O)-methyltransferase